MEISTHKIFDRWQCDDEYLGNLVIMNPEYSEAIRLGHSPKGIPETLNLYEERGDKIYVPRNIPINPKNVLDSDFEDKRVGGFVQKLTSRIKLKDEQAPAVAQLLKTRDGILEAGCGKGKTIMAIDALSKVGTTTLILVHKEFLMEQWSNHIRNWLQTEPGIVQGSTWKWDGYSVTIAMLQTLYSRRDDLPKGFAEHFGLVISDECHRVAAPTWSQVIGLFPAKRRWGLTASPKRADGLEIIFHSHLGEIVYTIKGNDLTPQVFMVKTDCFTPTMKYFNRWNHRPSLPKLITEITRIEKRNKKILRMLLDAAKAGRKILLLTDRVEHVKFLHESFNLNAVGMGIETSIYIGALGREERRKAEQADVIFATSQIAKEGLDIPELDTLFLVTPFGSEITVQQAAGRILREYPGKKSPMVIDFVDDDGICKALADKRARVYYALKYPIKVV